MSDWRRPTVPYESDFRAAGLEAECCRSCHEDAAGGYDMVYINPPDRGRYPRQFYDAGVCCGVSNAIDDLPEPAQRTLWAKAVRIARKR